MQNADLSLFRNASISKKHGLTHAGGDVFQVCSTPSDMSVLWGESFGSKERKFLREMLSVENVAFSLKDTYQIHIRTLFHAQANAGMNLRNGYRRAGLFAMLLHDLKGDLTTSWTWAKFIRPLFRKGFSILAVDFPGFGKSSVAQVPSCPADVWQGQEAHVCSKIMEEMCVARCQVLAVGHTCGMLLHMLQSSPHRMAGEHVLVNPIFDRNNLFHHVGVEPPPGAKAGWQEEIKAKQQQALIDLIRTTRVRLWCLFEMDGRYRDMKTADGKPPSKQLEQEWQMAYDTWQMLVEASKNEFIAENVKVTEITRLDLCEAQAGKRIPVRLLVPSRHLKASVARYMSSFEKKPWEEMYLPTHIAHQKGLSRSAKNDKDNIKKHLRGEADSDSDDDETGRGAGINDAAKRALAQNQKLIGRHKSVRDLAPVEVGQAERQAAEARALKAQQLALQDQHKPGSAGMASSSSTGALRKTAHSLSAAAAVAHGRLTVSGANANTRTLCQTAEGRKDAKAMNWTKVPFESDLSYGVRKMYLDTLEESVNTYREEAEKNFEAAEQANMRRQMMGFRGNISDSPSGWGFR